MIDYILFDMDNCLYPASAGLCTEMDRRISGFVADFLSIPFDEAKPLRKSKVKEFGTTRKWLEISHDFTDIDEFNRVIHPPDVENYLTPSPELKEMLSSLPWGASILTNAPLIHADRVLNFLGIKSYFDHILELGFSGTMGKPHIQTYQKAFEICGCKIESTLFLDDVPGYLTPFREMGGHILLVDEDNRHAERNLPTINSILELPGHIETVNKRETRRAEIRV